MPLVRMIISARADLATPVKDAVVNTLYFNVSNSPIDPTGYQTLVDDLWELWRVKTWAQSCYLDIRAYDMGDVEPRPVKAMKRDLTGGGARPAGVPQVALCLSYFADRNLPRQRGRIYLGPWATSTQRPSTLQMNDALSVVDGLAGLGGVNVDWSLYSPTTGANTRISNAWVDNAWDIIRSRRLQSTSRVTKTLNG